MTSTGQNDSVNKHTHTRVEEVAHDFMLRFAVFKFDSASTLFEHLFYVSHFSFQNFIDADQDADSDLYYQ